MSKASRRLLRERAERIRRMIDIDAPEQIIASMCIHYGEGVYGGKFRLALYLLKKIPRNAYGDARSRLWFWWQYKVKRRTDAEVDALIDAQFHDIIAELEREDAKL